MHQIRTDLAMESVGGRNLQDLPGIDISTWEAGGISITAVSIETEVGAQLLEKPIGQYITLECPQLPQKSVEVRESVSAILGEELSRLLPESQSTVLVIGLGNRMVTPDAIGPKTIDKVLVTRHLFEALPDAVDQRMGRVCAVAPGVLGLTGVETLEVVKGIVDHVKPEAVIAVDALAAQHTERIGTAIQLSSGGICPGSGVGNQRKAISNETLGVPVIALGVPTVIYAASLVRDAVMGADDGGDLAQDIERDVLEGPLGEMIVTPREVDDMVGEIARVLASGINRALHPGLSDREIQLMME